MIASAAIHDMQKFIDHVRDDDSVVCKFVRCAVERHLADLERQGDKDFPYYFDPVAAGIACDFFPMVLQHSVGATSGLPFILEPWQSFGIGCIFGWKRADDNARRFRRVYWSMGRKNGKSCLGSGLALFLASMDTNPNTGRPEDVAEIVLSATKKEQVTKVIFAEILRMRSQPKLRAHSELKHDQVKFSHNQGFIHCVGSDRAFDGLNPHGVIMDELHEWRETHRKFYDTMLTGSGFRTQPLRITLTTAGDDRCHLWKEEYRYAQGVATGEIEDPALFSYCFELDEKDDALDPDLWIKANPNLGVSVKLDFLEEQAREAKSSKLSLNRFTRYHGNRMVSAVDQAFDVEQWDSCEGELSDWSKADAIGAGVDIGGRDDLAAFALVARFAVDPGSQTPAWRYETKSWAYIAQDTERDITVQPFANWIYENKLHCVKYPISDLEAELVEQCLNNWVSDVAYDPMGGQQLAESVESQGIPIARMSQRCYMFNEPIKDMLQSIADGRFRHNGDPVLRWAAGNAVFITDRQDQVMFAKRDSAEKIDPIVAVAMAYRRAMVAPSQMIGKGSNDEDEGETKSLNSAEAAAERYAQDIFDDC